MRGSVAWKESIRFYGKVIADALTVTRFFISFLILICAHLGNKDLLGLVIFLVLAGWTTDVIDGNFARSDTSGRKSWIGDHEFLADLGIMYATLIYIISAGFLPTLPLFLYCLYVAMVALVWMNKAYVMAVSAPVSAAPIIVAFVHKPVWGWLFLAWIAVTLGLNWDRFKEEVHTFIRDVDK